MVQRILFALIVFVFSQNVFAVQTVIKGTAEKAEGYTIRLKSFTDYISYSDTIIAESNLDENGKFEFVFDIENPHLLSIKLGFQKSSIYVEPGKTYELKVHYDPEREQVSYLANYTLFFEFVDLPQGDLNDLISDFNKVMDRFLIKNYERLYKNKQTYLIDSLHYQAMRLNFSGNLYFNELVMFRLADMRLSINSRDAETTFFKYFGNKPVRYKHYEYMLFFNTFFHDYVKTRTLVIHPGKLRELINNEENPVALSTALKKDILLLDDRLRELVILRDLYYCFYDFDFKGLKVMQHLNYLKDHSSYPEHRQIARNIIRRIKALQPGSPMPGFALQNVDGRLKSNKDYIGKHLLINFWEVDCNDCFQNIDSLEYLQQRYVGKLSVIAVSGKKYTAELKKLIQDKNYSMEFMQALPDNQIYDDLKIRSLPAAILLDEKGNILLYPAILPGRGYKRTFEAVFKH